MASIEDPTSRQLYESHLLTATAGRRQRRNLKKKKKKKKKEEEENGEENVHDDENEDDLPITYNDDENDDDLPIAYNRHTQHGMMIDAGSQGTRIHVYEFEERVLRSRKQVEFAVNGLRLSFPTTISRWTTRLQPGLDTFAFVEDDQDMLAKVQEYLSPLLNFSNTVLREKEQQWDQYPIYLKATGGLRALPRPYRLRLMNVVRKLFSNTTFNPYFFETDHARVISGEEEAIYGWAAVNFAMGSLLSNSEGTGEAIAPANLTYGVLEMGGASMQISYFEPNRDVMANFFKLQIGSAKHWNVYAHSFLYFGIDRAYDRLNARLVTNAAALKDPASSSDSLIGENGVYNPCLPGGANSSFTSRVHLLPNGTLLPLSAPENASVLEAESYSAVLQNPFEVGNFSQCSDIVRKLLRKEANEEWCNFAHDRDCSFAGVYQPPLPITEDSFGEFIATSNIYDVWDFLELDSWSTVGHVLNATRDICSKSLVDLESYNQRRNYSLDKNDLTQFCFKATFVCRLLIDGIGFPLDYEITAVDLINGQKIGWALGSILYEINTLPWKFHRSSRYLYSFSPHGMLDGIAPLFPTNVDDGMSDMTTSIATIALCSVCMVLFLLVIWWVGSKKQFNLRVKKSLDMARSRGQEQSSSLIIDPSTITTTTHIVPSYGSTSS